MSHDPYIQPIMTELLTVFGNLVSQNTISAEGSLFSNVLWEQPQQSVFGFFLLEKRGNYYIVRKFLRHD